MRRKAVFVGIGIVVAVLLAGYFIAVAVIRKKVGAALSALPASLRITYTSLHPGILTGSLVIEGLQIRFSQDAHAHTATIDKVSAAGVGFWALVRSHTLQLRSLEVEGCTADLDEYLLKKNIPLPKMELPFTAASIGRIALTGLKVTEGKNLLAGRIELDSVINEGDSLRFGGLLLTASNIRYAIPEQDETAHLKNLELDSKKGSFSLDTLRILPSLDKAEIGRIKGHQVDVFDVVSEGIAADGLDVMGLMKHRLTADRVTIKRNIIHVYRDRRLPLEPGEKALPMESLKAMPVTVRIRQVKIGATTFSYEEFPRKGDKPGTMKIYRMTATLEPLINKPEKGDPAYITMTTEGSLMNSGTVTATTKMPLHKGNPYQVEGAFHELDVTKLNDPAEKLGGLHLESGLLNSLAFRFDMNEEKSTGKIVGTYHGLVVDKLKGGDDDKKVDKFKSFTLKKFIIPKDKDKSLPEKKRTGKVDYKRDPQRYFSYYLLHSLLVGVKSSFSLGFLLPG